MKEIPPEVSKSDSNLIHEISSRKLSLGSFQNLAATVIACRYLLKNKIEGDFVECGVWRGGQSIIAAKILGEGMYRNYWLFDTFCGMTPPTKLDVDYLGREAKNKAGKQDDVIENDWVYAEKHQVIDNIKNFGLDIGRFKLIAGDVVDTLKELDNLPPKISLLRLDTDWYESTKVELDALYDLIVPKGILIIDDYGHWKGAREAVDEFFEKRFAPLLIPVDYTCRIVIKAE